MRGTFSLKTENVYETAKTRSFFVSLIISPSGMVMIPISCSFCAFLLKRYMAAANIRFRIGFLSCDQYMTRMKRKSISGIVGSGHSSANIPFFHQPHRHREEDLIGFFGIHVDHHLARILPRREQKQNNWLLPQFCFALAAGVSVFNKL